MQIVIEGNDLVPEVAAYSVKDGQRTKEWREYGHLFHPCFNGVAGDFRALVYLGERGGPFVLLLWIPFLLPDTALSSTGDVLTLPWQLYRYYHLPEWVREDL